MQTFVGANTVTGSQAGASLLKGDTLVSLTFGETSVRSGSLTGNMIALARVAAGHL